MSPELQSPRVIHLARKQLVLRNLIQHLAVTHGDESSETRVMLTDICHDLARADVAERELHTMRLGRKEHRPEIKFSRVYS